MAIFVKSSGKMAFLKTYGTVRTLINNWDKFKST